MNSKTINISLPSELVERLDTHARHIFSTRSEFIRRAIVAQLQRYDAFEPELPVKDAEALLKKARREKLLRAMEAIPLKELNFND